ncbi:MAG: LytR/AlgR family response regulator transcription factor [Allomuricauda sp.]
MKEKWNDFMVTLRQVGLVMIVPYVLILAYFWAKEKVNKVTELENGFVVSQSETNNMLIIKGENDKIILAIKYEQLLYIKSAGNYLELFYQKGEQIAKELVRGSLKDLEDDIKDPSIVRIHRSHMVNMDHIASIKKTRKGYTISLKQIPEKVLVVSSGYREIFKTNLPT